MRVPNRIERRLAELGLTLPPAGAAIFSYQPVVIAGGFAFVSGQPPLLGTERPFLGRVGVEVSEAEAREAVKLSGLNILAQMKLALGGELDRIIRCVKLGFFINSAGDFRSAPLVANSLSDLMVEIMGEAGRHARFAVGTVGPMDFPCSVEAIFQVDEAVRGGTIS
ncbi:MAG: RidA family protein [Roseococcus sp.]